MLNRCATKPKKQKLPLKEIVEFLKNQHILAVVFMLLFFNVN